MNERFNSASNVFIPTPVGEVDLKEVANANYNIVMDELDAYKSENAQEHGDLTQLNTTDKSSLVNAIKEVKTENGTKASQAALNTINTNVNANTSLLATHTSQIASLASGAPKAVSLVSQMTDTTKNYVYTGSEGGYTTGNWYYWNGSAWTSGGVYQATSIGDKTVTNSKLADDAKLKHPFQPYSTFTNVYDIIKAIKDIVIYTNDVTEKWVLNRIWNNGGYLQIELRRVTTSNIELIAKVLATSLDFVTDKITKLDLDEYGSSRLSGYILINLSELPGSYNITNVSDLTYSVCGVSQKCLINPNLQSHPFAYYIPNTTARNTVKDVRIKTPDNKKYYLNTLRCNFLSSGSYSFIVEIADDTGTIVSRIQTAYSALQDGTIKLNLSRYNNSLVYGYIVLSVSSLLSFNLTGLNYQFDNSVVTIFEPKFILPAKIPCVVGKTLNFYFESIFDMYTDGYVINGINIGVCTGRMSSKLIPVSAGTSVISIYASYDGSNWLTSASSSVVTVAADAGTGLSKKVLVIGDSKTDNTTKLQELLTLFSTDVMSIELIGSRDTTIAPNEGISSWGIDNFASQQSYNSVTNPFYNTATSGFDFSYYMTNNGFSGVDIVIIDLGSNDGGKDWSTVIQPSYQKLIDSIHAYDPNIKIVISLQEGQYIGKHINSTAYATTKTVLRKINKGLIDTYDGKEVQNIFLLPQYINFDLENDFPMQSLPLSNRNTRLELTCTDPIHPDVYGYYKNADMYYYMIKYIASLG